MPWKDIIGSAFATTEEFSNYIDRVVFGLWRPRFVVVHNTGAPNMAQYAAHFTRPHPISDVAWMFGSLVPFYRDQQKWSAGPHLFVTPRNICVFTPLTGPGVHSPSWNSISWGVETVGDFNVDPFDGAIRDKLVGCLSVLHSKSGLQLLPYERSVRGLHLHKEDPKTTHRDCPGKHLDKADLIARVQSHIESHHTGDHQPPSP